LAWAAYQQLPLSGVHILTNQEPKSTVKCDIYLDDKPENCEELSANTFGRVAMWDRPWNQHSKFGPRIHTWQDFEMFVDVVKRDKGL
jgi:5'(3')-deoxyribonucleotidase